MAGDAQTLLFLAQSRKLNAAALMVASTDRLRPIDKAFYSSSLGLDLSVGDDLFEFYSRFPNLSLMKPEEDP